MEKENAIVLLWQNSDEIVANVYDNNPEISTALNTLIDGFEYPNYSHKKIQSILLSYFLKNIKEMELGRTLCHHALNYHVQEKGIELMPYFYNHSQCNWGMLSDDDQISNYVALHTKDNRILSRYKLDDGQDIYLITDFEYENEPRRTTAMFVQDY